MILSIVIVNWNTGKLLSDCLESIYANLPFSADQVETIIVDNASVDGSAQAAEACCPQVQVIYNTVNPGFGAANNQGLQQAKGRYALILNPDTLILPGALKAMLEFLEANPQVGAVGPRLHNPDRSLQYSCSPEPTVKTEFQRLFHLGGMRADGYEHMETWDCETPHKVDVLLGACIMARMDALQALKGFEEAYFMYSEEVDLCRRLRTAGWNLYWVPQAEIVHYGGQSTRLAPTEMFLQLYRSKILYFRRYSGRITVWAYKIVLAFASLLRMAVVALAPILPRDSRTKLFDFVKYYARLFVEIPHM